MLLGDHFSAHLNRFGPLFSFFWHRVIVVIVFGVVVNVVVALAVAVVAGTARVENFPKPDGQIAVVFEVLGQRSKIATRSAPILRWTDGPHAGGVRAT